MDRVNTVGSSASSTSVASSVKVRTATDPTAAALQLLIVALGVLALVAGIAVGLVPVTGGELDCGSAFFTGSDLTDTGKEYCIFEGGAGGRRVWAIGLILGGIAVLTVASLVKRESGRPATVA